MPGRRGGKLTMQINGNVFDVVGDFTYNLGAAKRDGLVGPDRPHGFKEMPQIPFIQGIIRDGASLDVKNEILDAVDATLTLKLANGKTILLEQAYYCLEGDITTEEAQIAIKFEGQSAEEIPA